MRTVGLAQQIVREGATGLIAPAAGNTFLTMAIRDLSQAPLEIDPNDPGSAIVKTIRSVKLQAGADESQVTATGEVTTDSPARADQVQQLLMGMKAITQFAALQEEDPNHPKAKQVAALLENFSLDHPAGSSTLTGTFRMGYDALLALKSQMEK